MLMLWIGAYAQVMQRLILGDPGEVTRDQLGNLGGNPHFRPPAPDPWTEAKQGLSVSSEQREAACQCCGTVAKLCSGPSRFGPETWACAECWGDDSAPLSSPQRDTP